MNAYVYSTIAVLAILPLLLWVMHKVRRVYLMLYRIDQDITYRIDNLFHQLEALSAIYFDLGLRSSLPPTRGWAASPDFLRELVGHAKAAAPRVIVECSSGVSTLILARCAQISGRGRVFSLEHDPVYVENTRGHLARHGLSDWATVFHASLRPHKLDGEEWQWYAEEVLPADIAIDMLVIDGPPLETGALARYPAGPMLFKRMVQNGTIFLDDANREPERATIERWQRENRNLRCQFIPCEKGCARLWVE